MHFPIWGNYPPNLFKVQGSGHFHVLVKHGLQLSLNIICFFCCFRFVCIRYPFFHRQTLIVRKMKLYILIVWFIIVVYLLMQIILLENEDFRTSPSKLCIWTNYFTTLVSILIRVIQHALTVLYSKVYNIEYPAT